MNIKLFTCALVSVIAPVFAAEGWMTNIEKAQETATKEKKAVFVEFTGSDWCPPCMELKKTVFDSEDFKKFASEHLVTVELDFPDQKEISAEQKAYNGEQAKKYNIKGYPTAILLDDNGVVFWRKVGGASGKEKYIADIKQGLEKKDDIVANLAKAKDAKGLDKAKLLDKALKSMDPQLKEYYSQYEQEIISLDTDDTLGYAKAKKKAEELDKKKSEFKKYAKESVYPLVDQKKYDEAIQKVEKYVEDLKTDDMALKQELLFHTLSINMQAGKIDEALKACEKIIALDEKSEMAEQGRDIMDYIKKNREKIEEQIKASQKL